MSLPSSAGDGSDPGGRRTFLKTNGDETEDDLGATEHFRRLFRNRRIDDHRRELYRVLRCWQDQLALPRHRSPSGKAVGSQSIALRNFIDRRARP